MVNRNVLSAMAAAILALTAAMSLPSAAYGQVAAPAAPAVTQPTTAVAASAARPAQAPRNLLEGGKWSYSTDEGKTFSDQPPVIPAGKTMQAIARVEFPVEDPSRYVVLELTSGLNPLLKNEYLLNDKKIVPPMEGMVYKTIPAIDPAMLVKGRNVLTANIDYINVSQSKDQPDKDVTLSLNMTLAALTPTACRIVTGPILGECGQDFFTVVFRMNMPARLVLEGISSSPRAAQPQAVKVEDGGSGLFHRLRVPLDPHSNVTYSVRATGQGIMSPVTFHLNVPPISPVFRFVAVGDSRTRPNDWATVAAAVVKAKPSMILFTGDTVSVGSYDWLWNDEFFGPAAELFGNIPFYPVVGNHEAKASVTDEFFYTPSKDGKGRNWSQELGGALFIGVDGAKSWVAGGDNAKWLEGVLAASRAKFIFLEDHYPPWTSGAHGKLDSSGKPAELTTLQAREVILPLLAKYKATAIICGHDHLYERSEVPDQPTVIIAGGGGAPLYSKARDAEKQNPYSKVFVSKLNYCVFEITGDSCTMKAFTPEGEQLDARTWQARETAPAANSR